MRVRMRGIWPLSLAVADQPRARATSIPRASPQHGRRSEAAATIIAAAARARNAPRIGVSYSAVRDDPVLGQAVFGDGCDGCDVDFRLVGVIFEIMTFRNHESLRNEGLALNTHGQQ